MNSAANNVYLYAAYAVVWIVHCAYALSLVNRGKRMKREQQELHRQ